GHGDHRRLEPLPGMTGVNVPLMRRPPEWMDRAACVDSDPEAIFVAGESALAEAVEAEAKAVCRTCDVAAECWQYATERGERFGIWAGVNLERERRRGIALKLSSGWVHLRADEGEAPLRVGRAGQAACRRPDPRRARPIPRRAHL